MARLTRQNPADLIEVYIVRHTRKTKPDRRGFREIEQRLYKKVQVLTILKFASLVTTGAAYAPRVSDGQGEVRQQVFTLDFSHVYFSPTQFREKCNGLNLVPALIVPSWRHSDTQNFFHAIFITPTPVVGEDEILKCYLKLFGLFKAANQHNSMAWFFVGSRPSYCIGDLSARVDLLNL